MTTAINPVHYVLDKGAELRHENPSTGMTNIRFIGTFGAKTTITDNGAVFYASANDVKQGVKLPEIKDSVGNAEVWTVGDTQISTEIYTDATATEGVTFKHAALDDPSLNPANVAYIETSDGKKIYTTSLQDAVNKVGELYPIVTWDTDEKLWESAGSPIIYVYKDLTISSTIAPTWWSTDYNNSRVKTVYIKSAKADGSNVKITSTADGAAFRYNAYYNLTLENVDLDCTRGFAVFWSGYQAPRTSGKSTANFINCNISATGTAGEGLVFKVTGNYNDNKTLSTTENYIINFVNTQVQAKKGVNAVFLFHHCSGGTVNIDGNSSFTHEMDHAAVGGDTMFMLGSHRKFTVNIEDGAELTANVKSGYNSSYNNYAMFRLENSNAYPSADGIKNVINIEKGVKLTINAGDTYDKDIIFIHNNLEQAKAKTVLNIESGVEFKLNAKATSLVNELIRGQDYSTTTATLLGWDDPAVEGVELISPSADSFAASEADATLVSVSFTKEDFDVFDGASIYTVDGKDGIRFSTKVSADLLDILGEDVTFGTILAIDLNLGALPLNLDTVGLKTDVPVAKAIESDKTKWDEDDNGATYRIALYDVGNESDTYRTEIAARGYMTVTYSDGTTATFYTEFDDNNVRSIYEVALALKAKGVTNDAIENIIDVAGVK